MRVGRARLALQGLAELLGRFRQKSALLGADEPAKWSALRCRVIVGGFEHRRPVMAIEIFCFQAQTHERARQRCGAERTRCDLVRLVLLSARLHERVGRELRRIPIEERHKEEAPPVSVLL
jgi:hypothetical protein